MLTEKKTRVRMMYVFALPSTKNKMRCHHFSIELTKNRRTVYTSATLPTSSIDDLR